MAIVLFKIIKNLVFKSILLILSYIIPKDNKSLFFSSVGNYEFPLFTDEKNFQFKESPKYLAIYSAKKLKNYKTYFHVPDKKMFNEIRELNIIPITGIKSFWMMLRAKYIFVDNINFGANASFLTGKFEIIQCWHGTPVKKIGIDMQTKNKLWSFIKYFESSKYKYYISTCKYSTKIFKRIFNTKNVLEIGFPRNDIFFNHSFFSIENIYDKLNLKKYKKVFLYAPTFRNLNKEVNFFSKEFLKSLDDILKKNKYIFLIKQHPYAKSTSMKKNYSNILDISDINQDIQETLIYSDVLITDYSSSFFDFLLLNKPIIFFITDLEEYEIKRGLYFKYDKDMPGPIVNNEKKLMFFINNINNLYSKNNLLKIRNFNNKFNKLKDGNSCERLFNILLK